MYEDKRNPFYQVKTERLRTESGIDVGKNVLINMENNNVVGIVSPNYELVKNETVSNLFQEAVKNIGISNITNHLDAKTRRWSQFIVLSDKMKYEVSAGDHVSLCIQIHNGYDAKTAYGYSLMGYRWLCENGMVMGKKEIFSDSFNHYNGNVQILRDSFELKFDMFKNNVETWRKWNSEKFNKLDFDNFITIHTKPEQHKSKKHEYITPKLSQDIKDSYRFLIHKQSLEENKWGAFNVLTYTSTHQTKARNGSNIFSAKYNNINRLANDFYKLEG